MPEDFNEIERRFGGTPTAADPFDAIEAQMQAKEQEPASADEKFRILNQINRAIYGVPDTTRERFDALNRPRNEGMKEYDAGPGRDRQIELSIQESLGLPTKGNITKKQAASLARYLTRAEYVREAGLRDDNPDNPEEASRVLFSDSRTESAKATLDLLRAERVKRVTDSPTRFFVGQMLSRAVRGASAHILDIEKLSMTPAERAKAEEQAGSVGRAALRASEMAGTAGSIYLGAKVAPAPGVMAGYGAVAAEPGHRLEGAADMYAFGKVMGPLAAAGEGVAAKSALVRESPVMQQITGRAIGGGAAVGADVTLHGKQADIPGSFAFGSVFHGKGGLPERSARIEGRLAAERLGHEMLGLPESATVETRSVVNGPSIGSPEGPSGPVERVTPGLPPGRAVPALPQGALAPDAPPVRPALQAGVYEDPYSVAQTREPREIPQVGMHPQRVFPGFAREDPYGVTRPPTVFRPAPPNAPPAVTPEFSREFTHQSFARPFEPEPPVDPRFAPLSPNTTPPSVLPRYSTEFRGAQMETAPESSLPGDPSARAGERGAVSPGGIGRLSAQGIRSFGATHIRRIRDLGTPTATELADIAEEILNVSGEKGGPLNQKAVDVQRTARRHPSADRSLSREIPVPGERFTASNLHEVVERRAAASSPAEAAIADSLRDLTKLGGETMESVGTLRDSNGTPVAFVTPGDVLPYIFHTEGIDVRIAGPNSPAWRPLIRGIAKLSGGIPEADVEKSMLADRDLMNNARGTGEATPDRKSEAEFFRKWRFPASVVTADGRRVRILENDPHMYAQRFAQVRAARAGVIKVVGQKIGGEGADDLRERFIRENAGRTGRTKAADLFDQTFRALGGSPMHEPLIAPGSALSNVKRAGGGTVGILKEGMMSGSAVSNLFEWLQEVGSLAGVRGSAKIFYRHRIEPLLQPEAHAARIKALHDIGAITDEVMRIQAPPGRPEEWLKVAKGVLSRVTLRRQVEQGQEVRSALAAEAVMERGKARKGEGPSMSGENDAHHLRALGWTEAQARKFAYGDATQAEYDSMLRGVPRRAVGANTNPVEASWLENTPASKSLLWFQKYWNMNYRQTLSHAEAFKDAMTGKDLPKDPSARWRRRVVATKDLMEFALRRAVSNASATMALSFLMGGKEGFNAKKEEMQENLWGFMRDSFVSSITGGPFGAVLRASSNERGSNVADAVAPVKVVNELIDAVSGHGRYKNASVGDTFDKLGQRFVPAYKAGRYWLGGG